jgi:glycosyltransferase involved in cell wall biosynthesis
MKFSVCIPNFNYASYLGRTIDSVLSQSHTDFEIPIADNNSTDASWEVIQGYVAQDNRVVASKNPTNVGFAGNLDAVSRMVTAEYTIMLSSDDLMGDGALETYKQLIKLIGNQSFIISSTWHVIDPNDSKTGISGPPQKMWLKSDIDEVLSKQLGCDVYKVKAGELLKRGLLNGKGAFNFAATCYRTEDYIKVGGYGGTRMMNPDKWFHFRLLGGPVKYAYFIDKPLFSYRVHPNNQNAQQKKSGALKFFVDEYRTTFEADKTMLEKAGIGQNELMKSYIYNIIHKYSFRQLKEGNAQNAFRLLCLGFATYPTLMFKRKHTYLLFLLVISGPIGLFLLKRIKSNYN